MSAYSDDLRNDSQGWADTDNGTYTGPDYKGTYDGTTVPRIEFVLQDVAAANDLSTAGLLYLWKTAAAGHDAKAKAAIEGFAEDCATAASRFNVTRHFWAINSVGGITGLLMYTCNYRRLAVLVRGYTDWVPSHGDAVLNTHETHANLEQVAVGWLVKTLR